MIECCHEIISEKPHIIENTAVNGRKLQKIRKTIKKTASTNANEIKVYPNPSPGNLYVSLLNPTDTKLYLHLYNAIGQLVFQREMETPGRDELISIPAAGLAKGTYLLQIRSEKSIKLVKKIIR